MVSIDTILELLSESRRRYALYHLDGQDEPVPVDELADAVAEMEADQDPGAMGDQWGDRIEVSLEHNHLPKAEDADFIEYEPDNGVVRLTGPPPEFGAIITVAQVVET